MSALDGFLAAAGVAHWERRPLAGDASSRHYERLRSPEGESAILMRAPTTERAALDAFVTIADWLRETGLAAPEIMAADAANGLLLLEDLGEVDLTAHLAAFPASEGEILEPLLSILARLDAASPPPGLPRMDPKAGAAMLAPLWEHYAPETPWAVRNNAEAAITAALGTLCGAPDRLSLRDFHAGNLIWRPDRKGQSKLGLLDFQDAFLAPRFYDLASYLYDARRAVSPAIRCEAIQRFAEMTDTPEARTASAVAALALQRNLRILGIFARLAAQNGKRQYLAFQPQVWAHIETALADPGLVPYRAAIRAAVNPPGPDHPRAAMIFAAGLGKRMGSLTERRPTPLVEVGGRTLLDHALDIARPAAPERIVVNTHYLAPQIAAHLAGTGVELSHEERLLETGGGLRYAMPRLGPGPVFTLNSDAIWAGPNPLSILRAAWQPKEMEALLLLLPKAHVRGHPGKGDFALDAEGRLRRAPDLIYSGAQIIRPEATLQEGEDAFSLNLSWDRIAARGRLYGVVYSGHWCDVGQPASIALAEEMLAGV